MQLSPMDTSPSLAISLLMDASKVEYQHSAHAMCPTTILNVYTEDSDASNCSSPEVGIPQPYQLVQAPTQYHQRPRDFECERISGHVGMDVESPRKAEQNFSCNFPLAAVWSLSSTSQLPAMKLHPLQPTEYTQMSTSEEITLPSLMILPTPSVQYHTNSLHHTKQAWQSSLDVAPSMQPRSRNVVVSATRSRSSTIHQVVPRRRYQRLSPLIRAQAIDHYVQSQEIGVGSARKPPHSNKPYTTEQVHFMRYMKVDCDHNWKDITEFFRARWTDIYLDSTQCLSSRNYRDNKVPLLDANDEPMFTASGKPRMRSAKCRDRTFEDQKDFPITLIDKHPEAALKYDWVSKEHKNRAYILANQLDPVEANSRREVYRRAIKKVEDYLEQRRSAESISELSRDISDFGMMINAEEDSSDESAHSSSVSSRTWSF